MYPDDPRSPFFHENENEIAPLARLHLNRINLIPKSCSDRIITDLIDELTVSENLQDKLKREYFYLFFTYIFEKLHTFYFCFFNNYQPNVSSQNIRSGVNVTCLVEKDSSLELESI